MINPAIVSNSYRDETKAATKESLRFLHIVTRTDEPGNFSINSKAARIKWTEKVRSRLKGRSKSASYKFQVGTPLVPISYLIKDDSRKMEIASFYTIVK